MFKFRDFGIAVEEIPPEENYDSDSSLTQAANRSLDLSRSLGDKCVEITQGESSDDETENRDEQKEQPDFEVEKDRESEEKQDTESRLVDIEPVHIVDVSKTST